MVPSKGSKLRVPSRGCTSFHGLQGSGRFQSFKQGIQEISRFQVKVRLQTSMQVRLPSKGSKKELSESSIELRSK